MAEQKKCLVLVRVKRPGPETPIAQSYIRRRAGRTFEGERVLHKVTDEQFEKLGEGPRKDAISESQLLVVMDDPYFHVEDPYAPPTPTESKLDPKAEAERKAREMGERGPETPKGGGPKEPAPLKKK